MVAPKVWFDNHPIHEQHHLVADFKDNIAASHNYPVLERIIEAYNKADESRPNTLEPNDMWKNSINNIRSGFVEALKGGDKTLVEGYLSNFYRNELSEHLVKHLPYYDFKGDEERESYFSARTLSDLVNWVDYSENPDIDRLTIPNIGNPYGIRLNGKLIGPSSLGARHYADQVIAILSDRDYKDVTEIGGGIGTLAYFLLADGIDNYSGYDIPEILAIQQYFLMNAFPERSFQLYGEVEDLGATIELMPYWCFNTALDTDIVVNFHSMSEMPIEVVQNYLDKIADIADYFYHENSGVGQKYNESPTTLWKMPSSLHRLVMHPTIFSTEVGVYREYIYKRSR